MPKVTINEVKRQVKTWEKAVLRILAVNKVVFRTYKETLTL